MKILNSKMTDNHFIFVETYESTKIILSFHSIRPIRFSVNTVRYFLSYRHVMLSKRAIFLRYNPQKRRVLMDIFKMSILAIAPETFETRNRKNALVTDML